MPDFVIRIPLDGAGLGEQGRLARMAERGWGQHTVGGQMACALRGDGAPVRVGSLTMIGLAILNNRAELCERLGQADPDVSDLALLARLRHREGPDFVQAVSGAFSVVVLDGDTGQGTGYRDHFGLIPFYYCTHDGHLTCGSDLRATLHLSGLPLVENAIRIADFIVGHEVDTDRTAFDGLNRLPAAHLLDWQAGRPEPRRYWQMTLPDPIASEKAVAGFLERIKAATQTCVEPAEGVGAMLSGGLDSSALTGLAARALETRAAPPLPALSFVYPGQPYDESRYIDAANRAFCTEPYLIEITTSPRLADMPQIVEEQMDLFLGYGIQKSRGIYWAARDRGLNVLIDGFGGDEVVSHGYDRLIELGAERRWLRLFFEFRGASKVHGRPFWKPYLMSIAQNSRLPPGHIARRMLMRIARRLGPDDSQTEVPVKPEDLLSRPLRAAVDTKGRYVPPARIPATFADRRRAESLAHLATLEHPLMQHAFEVMHRTAQAAEITPRYPFFERRLVEFCLSMPSDVKLRDGKTRWVLREAMAGILPERIRTRATKAEFSLEFRTSIRDYMDEHAVPCFVGTERFVDAAAAETLERYVGETSDGDVEAMRAWWRILVLRDWMRAFDRWRTLNETGDLL